MKQLILVRHAKAGWGAAGSPDFERTLSTQGERDAETMAGRLALRLSLNPPEAPPKLDRIMCSSAQRTRTTAEALARTINYPIADIELDKNLYLAELDTWLETIQCLPEQLQFVVMVGHNPALTDLANCLANNPIAGMPPGGMLYLQFGDIEWQQIGSTKPTSEFFDYPALGV